MEYNMNMEEAIRKEINAVTCKQLMLRYLMGKYHGQGVNVEKIIDQYRFDVFPVSVGSLNQDEAVEAQPSSVCTKCGTHVNSGASFKPSKPEVRRILSQNAIQLPWEFTFAHKGDIAYWANPNEKLFNQPYWHLVLWDDDKRILHYFKVPSEIRSQLVRRHDLPHLFDVQIDRYDVNFTDIRSGVRFICYYVNSVNC